MSALMAIIWLVIRLAKPATDIWSIRSSPTKSVSTVSKNERQVPTSSSDSTKRNWEEKPSAKSSKPQSKKLKVGAALNPTQAKDTRAVKEN
uniref:Uncharacterized protein n=1 Tax=Romanomermis culicivorax TaxID=13658 RepID=A0A915HPB9_ROMCU